MPSSKKKKKAKKTNIAQAGSVDKDAAGRLVDPNVDEGAGYRGAMEPSELEQRARAVAENKDVPMAAVDGEEGGSTRSISLGAFGGFNDISSPEDRKVLLDPDVAVAVGENASSRIADVKGTKEVMMADPKEILNRQRPKNQTPSVTGQAQQQDTPQSEASPGATVIDKTPVVTHSPIPTVEIPPDATMRYFAQENAYLHKVVADLTRELGKPVQADLDNLTLDMGDEVFDTIIQVVMTKRKGEKAFMVVVDDEVVPVNSFEAKVSKEGEFIFRFVEERSAFDER